VSQPSLTALLRREPVYTPVIGVAINLFRALGLRLDETGKENVPASGGGVVVMNHTGYLDFALAGVPFWHAHRRMVRFMAKDQVFSHKASGPLMRGMKHIPVDRGAGADAYAQAVAALRRGELIGVFPEATISQSFTPKEWKSGAARMAAEAGVPIIPVAIWGSHRVWTKARKRNLRGARGIQVVLSVGAPIPVAPDADVSAVTAQAKAALQALLDAAMATYPTPGDGQWWQPAHLGGSAPTREQGATLDAADAALKAEKRAAAKAKSADAGA
jgi:1-acyl-sn-glycerol-3-phosphate acyltransferase